MLTKELPIYTGPVTLDAEAYVRLVHGQQLNVARFSVTQFPIPKHQRKTASLYELQELSRLDPQKTRSDEAGTNSTK